MSHPKFLLSPHPRGGRYEYRDNPLEASTLPLGFWCHKAGRGRDAAICLVIDHRCAKENHHARHLCADRPKPPCLPLTIDSMRVVSMGRIKAGLVKDIFACPDHSTTSLDSIILLGILATFRSFATPTLLQDRQ